MFPLKTSQGFFHFLKMLFPFCPFSFFFFSIFCCCSHAPLSLQMDNKNSKRHSDEVNLNVLAVPLPSVPENSRKLLMLGQSRKRHQQKKSRQKGRTHQKQRLPSTITPPLITPLLINAAAAFASSPPPPPILFDQQQQGGGGQWELPVVEADHAHHPHHQLAKMTHRGEEHSVVHLISRPTQLYYFGGGGVGMDHRLAVGSSGLGAEQLASASSVQIGIGQVCRVKVPTADVFYMSYEDDESGAGMGRRPFVDVFFHCSQYWAWCCGVDCCQLDPALVFTGACVLVVVCALLVHCCWRSEFGQRVCVRRLLFRVQRRRRPKRVIARANAQRRKSTLDGGTAAVARADGAMGRKPSATVSSGDAEQYSRQQQQQQPQRGGSVLRRIIRDSIRETIGRGHRRLVRKGHQLRGDLLRKAARTVPEIVVTEPSSSCYGEEEEETEQYEER